MQGIENAPALVQRCYQSLQANLKDRKIILITEKNINDYVQFKNNDTTLSTSNNDYAKFIMSGTISGSGNLQSLLNFTTYASDYCFRRLFQECTSLIKPPDLLAVVVSSSVNRHVLNNP